MAMTPEEKTRFETMEKDISSILEKVDEQAVLNHSILRAIKGDDMGNPGITFRLTQVEREIHEMKLLDLKSGNFALVIDEMKKQNEDMRKQMLELKEEKIRNSGYFKVLAWIAGLVGASIIAFIMKNLLHPPSGATLQALMGK